MTQQELILEKIQDILTKRYKGNVLSFSRTLGISHSSVVKYIKGERGISLEFVLAVLNKFHDISAEWLLRGLTDPRKVVYVEKPAEKEYVSHETIKSLANASVELSAQLCAANKKINELNDEIARLKAE